MRIIAGNNKGHSLKTVGGMATRPTQDRVKEALFNIIGDHVEHARVLDLYAGTGSLGLESMSRGAISATFVDFSKNATTVLEANMAALRVKDCRILGIPVEKALRKLAVTNESFDLIFMDPPYGRNLVIHTLEMVFDLGIAARNARVVAEHESKYEPPKEIGDWFRIDLRKYGDTGISIYSCLSGGE